MKIILLNSVMKFNLKKSRMKTKRNKKERNKNIEENLSILLVELECDLNSIINKIK